MMKPATVSNTQLKSSCPVGRRETQQAEVWEKSQMDACATSVLALYTQVKYEPPVRRMLNARFESGCQSQIPF
jgi:hypothetical protein